MNIKNVIQESYFLRRTYVSDGIDKALDNLSSHTSVPYRDFKFSSGTEHNGWVIPKKWEVYEAKILKDGKVFYDGMAHPAGVITQSSSFEGIISKDELVEHLYYTPSRPHAIPLHFRMQYRPWESGWGFCLPKVLFDTLPEGNYEVRLKTALSQGEMVVREFTLQGDSDETIIFVAHDDHPGLSNNDIAGCAVGIAFIEGIKNLFPTRRYTYKLLLGPEITSSVFYLSALSEHERKNIKFALFLEALGNDNTLNLQKSFLGDTYIDRIAALALQNYEGSRLCGFRESMGNDEIVFEAPGIEIPMPSLSRWPYPEYNSSDETLDIISEEKLQEACAYLFDLIGIAERDRVVQRNFDGLISLANPRYDLYIDPGQIITGDLHKNIVQELFQYKLPRLLDGTNTISDIARQCGVDFKWLYGYLKNMEEKNLIVFNNKKII
ncbi:MAG: DUF4910 domain-containing protein [Patescibacteria group bacterium]|nr:DUF4910 domain-containing protein [Patescibacteria group bacterium]MDE2438446.1 DUF4910 domain-containing protein [Patescibacteria group bacterium]